MNTADQCRERGLKVGDTIEGRTEGPGTWWDEARLTLLWMGETACAWNVQTRNTDRPNWSEPRESAGWDLSYRHWMKVGKP